MLRVPPSFAASEAVCWHVTRPAVKLESLRAQLPLPWQRSSASGGQVQEKSLHTTVHLSPLPRALRP